jgi:diguanylate cyclase (GGDEF)-like protein
MAASSGLELHMDAPLNALEPLLQRAEAARAADALADGLAAAEAAWALCPQADDAQRLRAGLLLLHFRYRSGALGGLVDAGLDVLPLLRAAQRPVGERIDTLRMVVMGAADVGRFETALALGQEAHHLAEGAGDGERLAMALTALGAVYERMGDPWHAERLLLDALAQAREARSQRAEFVTLNNLVATLTSAYYLQQGAAADEDLQALLLRAEPHALAAQQLATQLDDAFYTCFVRGNHGELLVHLGRTDDARRELDAAMAIAREHGFDAQAWRIAGSLGELLLREGRADEAWLVLQQVLQASAAADARMTHLRLHHALWRAARALGRPQAALDHLERYQQLEHARMLNQLRNHSRLFVTQVEAQQVRLEARLAAERAALAERRARADPLTGLGNRRELDERWPPLQQRLAAQRLPVALAMLDLDHFKRVNDSHGHGVGDAVLVELARLLQDGLRSEDLIIRMGGEEFLVVLPEAGTERALEACERLRQRTAAHGWDHLAKGLRLTLSIGVASAVTPCELQALIERADAALYVAKRGGRNRVAVG